MNYEIELLDVTASIIDPERETKPFDVDLPRQADGTVNPAASGKVILDAAVRVVARLATELAGAREIDVLELISVIKDDIAFDAITDPEDE